MICMESSILDTSLWHLVTNIVGIAASSAKEDATMPTSFGVKLILLVALSFVFYMVTLGKWATNLG